MSKPHVECDFTSHVETGPDNRGVLVTVCRTHGYRLEAPTISITVTRDGGYMLCPVGKIELAVQQGIERLQRKLEDIEDRLKEAFPERS